MKIDIVEDVYKIYHTKNLQELRLNIEFEADFDLSIMLDETEIDMLIKTLKKMKGEIKNEINNNT